MFYYVYQITNLVNAKIYVGVHKSKSLNDGYMGSGKIIKNAIEKYGISNFKKDILEFFETSEAMYAKEKEIVTDEFLLREDTYNLRRGGTGGFDYIISTNNHISVHNKGKIQSREQIEKRINTTKRRYESGDLDHIKNASRHRMLINNPMASEIARKAVSEANTGVAKSEEHKKNISNSMIGKNKGKKFPNRKSRDSIILKIVTCPHCGKSGKSTGMTRWHFDKCKILLSNNSLMPG